MNYKFNGGIYFLGDTHSVPIVRGLLGHVPPYSLVQHCGDLGLGFQPYEKDLADLGLLQDLLDSRGITLWVVRGNHCDPSFYTPQNSQKLKGMFPNIELLPDYTRREINGQSFLFVGGAVSIDRALRIPNRSWWADEPICKRDISQISECDVLVCHSAPSWLGPSTESPKVWDYAGEDRELLQDLRDERQYLDDLFIQVKPKYFWAGHFHESVIMYQANCKCRILQINELVEFQPFGRK